MAAMAFTAAYFYPRSPCGERLCPDDKQADFCQFLSTLSLRRATALFGTTTSAAQFLSTLSLRRATIQCSHGAALLHISIHALLAESDGGDAAAGDCTAISIHALLAESDATAAVLTLEINQFLSTLSLRRATGAATNTRARHLNFYPRSPCGERRNNSNNELVCTVFLSTLSLRRATVRD